MLSLCPHIGWLMPSPLVLHQTHPYVLGRRGRLLFGGQATVDTFLQRASWEIVLTILTPSSSSCRYCLKTLCLVLSRPHEHIKSVLFYKINTFWIKKMRYICTMEYYSAIKKNKVMPLAATWIDLEILILNEVCQTEKDKYMISLICGI